MQNPHMLLVLAACMLVVPLYAHAQEVSLSEQIRSDDRYFGFSDKLLHLIDENAMYEHNFMIVPHRLGDDSGTIKLTAETIASLLINHYGANATVVSHPVFGYVAEAAIPASVLPDILQHRFVGVIIAKVSEYAGSDGESIIQHIKKNSKFNDFEPFWDVIENGEIDVVYVAINIGVQDFSSKVTYNSQNMRALLDVVEAISDDRVGVIPPFESVKRSNTLSILLPIEELPGIAGHGFVKSIYSGRFTDGFGIKYLDGEKTEGIIKIPEGGHMYSIPYTMTDGEITYFELYRFQIKNEQPGSITLEYPISIMGKAEQNGNLNARGTTGNIALSDLETEYCKYTRVTADFGKADYETSVFSLTTNVGPEMSTDLFNIDTDRGEFEVSTIQPGKICGVEFVPEDKKLEITVKPLGKEAHVVAATIPYGLLGDEFAVLVNGKSIEYDGGVKSTISNTIQFTPHLEPGVENTIEITGNKLFPPPYVLPTESGQTIKIRNTGDELKYVMDGGSIQSVETFYTRADRIGSHLVFMLINMTATEPGSLTITLPQDIIRRYYAYLFDPTVDGVPVAITDEITSLDTITIRIPFLRGAEHITIRGASETYDKETLWDSHPRFCFWAGSCPTKALGVEFVETNQIIVTDSKNDESCSSSLCLVPKDIMVNAGDAIQWNMDAEKNVLVHSESIQQSGWIYKKVTGNSQRSTFTTALDEPGLHFYRVGDANRHAHGFILVQDAINITEKPQTGSLVISDIRTVNSVGEDVSVLEQNQMVHIAAEIRSMDGTELPFVYQIAPANSAASSIAGTIAANRTVSAALSWIPDIPGNHTVLVYAGEDRDSLTQRGSVSVRIGDTGGYIPPDDALPEWVKNNAGFFTKGNNSDDAKKAIDSIISYIAQDAKSDVPEWVKDAADWWVAGRISDQEFIKVIEYLAELEKRG